MHYYSLHHRANTNDGLNFVRYKQRIMANRKSIQQNIQHISGKITEFNADLQSRKELSVLDIDLLRKHVIDLYDEVNHLRLVMKETIDHGPWTMEERKAKPAAEAESEVGDEETGGQGDDNRVRHLSGEPVLSLSKESKTDKHETQGDEEMRSEDNNIEALSKAETKVEAEAEVEALVEAIVEEKLPDDAVTQNPEPITQNPLPAEALAKEGEIKLAAAEAKVEADAIKAAMNPEEANDLAFKFSNTPIHDLKKAISIAEKFEFINSLFGGNVEKYAYSIHHLNNLDNGDEAFTYLHDLRMEWKWDDEDKNFQKLANLIRRRFLG